MAVEGGRPASILGRAHRFAPPKSFFSLAALRGVAAFFEDYLTTWIGSRVVLALRSDLYQHLQRLNLSFYNQRRVGDLVARLTGDVTTVENLLVAGIGDILTDALTLF